MSKKLTRTLGVECIVTGNYDLYVLVILIVIDIVIVIGLKRYSSALQGIRSLQLMSDGAENNEGHILSSTNKDGQTLLCCVFTNAMVRWYISSKKSINKTMTKRKVSSLNAHL